MEGQLRLRANRGSDQPSGETWSRLCHWKRTFPVAMSSSAVAVSTDSSLGASSPTLEDGVDNPRLVGRAAIGRQVPLHGLVDLDQGRRLIDDDELVLVAEVVPACAELPDRVVVLVEKGVMAVGMAVWPVVPPLEADEHVLPEPARCLEVCVPRADVGEARPHQVAGVGQDVGARLRWEMLELVDGAAEGRDEQVAGSAAGAAARRRDVEPRRSQVRAALEGRVGHRRRDEKGGQDGADERLDERHGGQMVDSGRPPLPAAGARPFVPAMRPHACYEIGRSSPWPKDAMRLCRDICRDGVNRRRRQDSRGERW